MRSLTLLATGLLTAAVLTRYAPAQAAGETCQGKPATGVGQPLQRGFPGTDDRTSRSPMARPISTLSAATTSSCAADVHGRYPQITLRAGAGNEVVDALLSRSWVLAELGTGADHYVARAGPDFVSAGSNEGGRTDDPNTVIGTATGDPN